MAPWLFPIRRTEDPQISSRKCLVAASIAAAYPRISRAVFGYPACSLKNVPMKVVLSTRSEVRVPPYPTPDASTSIFNSIERGHHLCPLKESRFRSQNSDGVFTDSAVEKIASQLSFPRMARKSCRLYRAAERTAGLSATILPARAANFRDEVEGVSSIFRKASFTFASLILLIVNISRSESTRNPGHLRSSSGES
jgi:hypothetical protein